MDSIIIDITWWKILAGIILIIIPIIMYRRTFPPLPLPNRVILSALRILGFILILVFLLDPVVVSVTTRMKDPVLLELVDVSRSMKIEDCGGKSRIESAVDFLRAVNDTIGEIPDLRIDIATFSEDLNGRVESQDSIFRAAGEGTDIIKSIHSAVRQYSHDNLGGIMLVSDGRVTRGLTGSPSGLPVPVFTAGFGDTLGGLDVSISEVVYQRVGYVGTRLGITVYLEVAFPQPEEIEVRLMEGEDVIDRGKVRTDENTVEAEIELEFIPRKEGGRKLSVEAVPLAGEEKTGNNREIFGVDIFKDKIRVLLFDQSADWNMTFLRGIADRSERMTLETVTYIPAKGNVVIPGKRSWDLGDNGINLKDYDLILIGDTGTTLSESIPLDELEEYLNEGGGVLFIAGENSPLLEIGTNSKVERIAPFGSSPGPVIRRGSFQIDVVEEGYSHPFILDIFRGRGGGDLPPLKARISGLNPSAGAEVLLVAEDGVDYPFLVIQRTGDGISAATTCFPLWVWKLEDSSDVNVYHTFWGGLIQYLAEQFSISPLDLITDRSVYRRGDRINMDVHLRDERYTRGVRGEIYRGDPEGGKLIKTFSFNRKRDRGSNFSYQTGWMAPGEYTIVAREIREQGRGAGGRASVSVIPQSVEFINSTRDNSFLQRLAEFTGGVNTGSDPASVIRHLSRLEKERVERREEFNLGKSKWLFIAIILIMASEWIMRKSWGLV